MNWTFCCIPLERSSTFLSAHSARPSRSSHAERAALALGPRHAADLRQEDDEVEALHLPVDAPLLGQIPHLASRRTSSASEPNRLDPTLVGMEDPHDHADGRGLAGAVGPEEPVDHTPGHLQVQALHRGVLPEALGDALETHREVVVTHGHSHL